MGYSSKALTSIVLALLATLGCSSGPADPAPPRDAGAEVFDDAIAPADVQADVQEAEAAPPVVCGVALASDDPCQACGIEQCCSEVEACADDEECGLYAECAAPCAGGDWDCVDACALAYPWGYAKLQVLAACEAAECNAACGYAPEQACGQGWIDEVCQSCSLQQCCEELYAMRSNMDVWELVACQIACQPNDYDCLSQCIAQHEEGYAKYQIALNCSAIKCTEACEATVGESAPCGLGLTWAYDATDCVACLEQQCCETFVEKSLFEDQWRLAACMSVCEDDDCINKCVNDHIEGAAIHVAARGCMATHCADECDWTGSRCGGTYYLVETCDDCAQLACCDQLTAAGTSFERQAWLRCNNACGWGDIACQTQCVVSYPDGKVLDQLASVCLVDSCSGACGASDLTCGMKSGNSPDCSACVETSCCDVTHACAVDFDCGRIELCRHLERCDNDDTACLDSCRNATPDGVALFDAALNCRQSSCLVECASF